MASMDVFNSDAFGLIAMSGEIDRMDYVPTFLGSLGIFTPEPVTQSTVWIDERDGAINLVATSERGAPPKELVRDTRKARAFKVPRLAKGTTLYAYEVAGLRAFGTESEQTAVMAEYLRRVARINNDMELTFENMRLGALKGELLDADGSTIYDWFTEFDITPPTDVAFDFTDDTAEIPETMRIMKRSIIRSARGAIPMTARIEGIAGDEFFDALVKHPSIKEKWLNWTAAAELRNIDPFAYFDIGGVRVHNYRGTDDTTTVDVAADEAHFFPVGGQGVFSQIMAPADEFMPYVGTPGQRAYAMTIRDRDRDAWVRGETYSYPLFICKRPEVLRKGVMT